MAARFIYGTLLIVAIFGLLAVDVFVFPAGRPCIAFLIGLLALVGWWELVQIFNSGTSSSRKGFFWFGLLGIAYFHALAVWAASPDSTVDYGDASLAGVAALLFGAFCLAVFRRDFLECYRPALETVVGVLLLGFLFSHVGRLYQLPDGPRLVILLFAGIKGTDIAAFLIGKHWGRRRFLPVSPKKSVEGCLAALAWGALWFGSVALFLGPESPWSVGMAAGLGIILAVVAQIGDFSESLIKRKYAVKDSRALIPEFGGVLDLIDSLLFTGYLFWCVV